MNKKILRHALSAAIEFSPILAFIFVFEFKGFVMATYTMITLTLLGTLFLFLVQKQIPLFSLIVTIITVSFAFLSLLLHNPKIFILRDTFYDYFFAGLLGIGLLSGKQTLKKLFGHIIDMSNSAWMKVTYIWLIYFIVSGTLNEYIRRSQGLHLWVTYKGVVILTTLFLIGITAYLARKSSLSKEF